MTAYEEFMSTHIIESVRQIEDPMLLSVCLKAICAQRCAVGGAPNGTCKGCVFQCYQCRELNQIADMDLEVFTKNKEGGENK